MKAPPTGPVNPRCSLLGLTCLHSWTPTAPAPQVAPAAAQGPARAKPADAPPARRAAAPAAPRAVPGVPRAASAKGPRTSAAAVPEVWGDPAPDVNRATWTNLYFAIFHMH